MVWRGLFPNAAGGRDRVHALSFRFDEEEFRRRAAAHLHVAPPDVSRRSDDDLNPQARLIAPGDIPKPAAVLVPLVARAGEVVEVLAKPGEALESGQSILRVARFDTMLARNRAGELDDAAMKKVTDEIASHGVKKK